MRLSYKETTIVAKTPNILDSEQVRLKSGGITIDASLVTADANGNKILPVGTILAQVTATGLYEEYDSTKIDGRQAPKYLLFPDQADVTLGNASFGAMDMGRVIIGRLPKAPDATVITALKNISFVD